MSRYARLLSFRLSIACCALISSGQNLPLMEGTPFTIRGKTAQMTKLEGLPFVENEYTKIFKFDSARNPKLKELRDEYELDAVIAPGKDEFEQQLLLLDWVHHRFQKFGQPSTSTRGALEILSGIDAGHSFFCTQYAQLFASAAASLGWVDRVLALRRHQDAGQSGSTEHSTTEIWSNRHRKWVMLDPTSNLHLEKNGVPLNAHEIRQEWFYHAGTNLVFVIGKRQQKYRKADLPIFLKRFAGFGDLTIDPHELDKYGFIGYIPNTDLMDSGFDYGQMFIVKDQLCDGTPWHQRKLPANPAVDPYFPVGQATLSPHLDGEKIVIYLHTLTPNFAHYQIRIDHRAWAQNDDVIQWQVHSGTNHLEARTMNAFGVAGPISRLEVKVAD